MGKVVVQASMSLDGFIADTNDQVGPLFDWYGNGRRGCCSKTQTSFKAIE